MQTSTSTTSITTGIHCKVSCNNQYRRFFFTNTDYQSLYKQVQSLLALENEFVLKYKDDEGDLISISSDEELSFAVNFIGKGGVLRLTVALQLPVPTLSSPKEGHCHPHHHHQHHHQRFEHPGGPWQQGGPWQFHRGGFGGGGRGCGFGGGRGRYGPPCRYGKHESRGHEDKRSWLIHKRDRLNERLASLSTLGELNPHQVHCKEMLLFKIQRIEARLANVQGGGDNEKFERKCHKKFDKRERKCHKKERKCEKKMNKHCFDAQGETVRIPSDDMALDQQQPFCQQSTETQSDGELVKQLKEQLRIQKPALVEAKVQLKEKKVALHSAKRSGASPQEIAKLEQEVAVLKEAKRARCTELKPLRQQIYSLEEVRRIKK